MSKLKVPSLQHLARNWGENPDFVRKKLVNLVLNPPIFGYGPLFGAVEDMLIHKQPYGEIVEGMKRAVKKESVLNNYLEVLPLIRDHFEAIHPNFVQQVPRSFYSAGRGLLIPFEQPLIYGLNGQIYFPWLSFWRSNPLADKRLQLFVTIVDEMMRQHPDLESAFFQILDFSKPDSKQPRSLTVLDARDIPRLSETEKVEMLAIFAEGYFLALAELESIAAARKQEAARERHQPASDHPSLFGDSW